MNLKFACYSSKLLIWSEVSDVVRCASGPLGAKVRFGTVVMKRFKLCEKADEMHKAITSKSEFYSLFHYTEKTFQSEIRKPSLPLPVNPGVGVDCSTFKWKKNFGSSIYGSWFFELPLHPHQTFYFLHPFQFWKLCV